MARVYLGGAPWPRASLKLADSTRARLEARWNEAAQDPAQWRRDLAERVARPTGRRNGDEVARAWGLPPVYTEADPPPTPRPWWK